MQVALLLTGSLGVILWGAHLFTGSVEFLGRRLGLTRGAVGSLLAAVGTALPESLLPVTAILLGTGHAKEEVGVGAILGAPLMLSTIAMAAAGCTLLACAAAGQRQAVARVDASTFRRDMTTFLLAYGVAILAAIVPGRPAKLLIAAALVVLYISYARATLRGGGPMEEGTGAPRALFGRTTGSAVLQAAVALLVIIAGARLFAGAAQAVAAAVGLSPFLFSALVAPIATELPEKFNSVIWIARGEDTLAFGNITGALVFQSTVIPALGILLTPWQLGSQELSAALLAVLAAATMLFGWSRRQELTPHLLLGAGLFYAVFCLLAVTSRGA
jgi:cation:H+ antiporter